MTTYSLKEVKDQRDLERWTAFTDSLYPDSFIPPLRQHIARIFKGATPYSKDIQAKLFLVEDQDNDIVARTSAHASAKFDRKMGGRIQLFGFTEFNNDFCVFDFLFTRLTEMGQADKRKTLFGPANLLPSQFGGVITNGFEHKGFVDNSYNHAYYPEFYGRWGFKKAFESQTYACQGFDRLDPAALFPFDPKRIEPEKLAVHYGCRREFVKQLPVLREMLNASFDSLGYYTPISAEELRYQTDGLEFIMDDELFIYLTKNGVPVGFVLCIPDMSDFIYKIKGNLNAVNLIRLLLSRSRLPKEAILIIKGIIPQERGRGYMELLSQKLLEVLRKNKYETLKTTWIEKDNKGSSRQFLKMNGKVLHDLAFYQKPL